MVELQFFRLVIVFSAIWNVFSCTPIQETGSEASVITPYNSFRPLYNEKQLKENETWNIIIKEYRKKRDLRDGDKTYNDFKTYLNLTDAKITKAENDIKEISIKMKHYEEMRHKEVTNLALDISNLETHLSKVSLETDALHLKVTGIETENQEVKKEINEIKAKVSEMKTGKKKMIADIIHLKNAIQKQRTNINELKAISSIINADNVKLNLEHDYVNNETVNLKNKIAEIALEVNNNEKDMNLAKRKYEELENQFHTSGENIKKLKHIIIKVQDDKDMIINTNPIGQHRKERNIDDDSEKYKELVNRLDLNYNNIYNLINYTETILDKQKDYEKKCKEEAAATGNKINELKTKFSNIYSQVTDFQSKINGLETNKLEIKEDITEMKREVSELKTGTPEVIPQISNDINKLTADNNELQKEINKLKAENELLKQNYGNLKGNSVERVNEVTKLREKVTSLADEMSRTNQKYEDMKEQILLRDEELKELSYNITTVRNIKNCELNWVYSPIVIYGLEKEITAASESNDWTKCIDILERNLVKSSIEYKQLQDIKDINSLVWIAAERGYTALINVLISNGLPVNKGFEGGKYTMLHLAAANGNCRLLVFLINNGANIEAKDSWGWSAVHHAAVAGQLDIIKLLVKRGANVNVINATNGYTALHYAAFYGHASVVHYLVTYTNCDRSIRDGNGKTAQDIAKNEGFKTIVKILIK